MYIWLNWSKPKIYSEYPAWACETWNEYLKHVAKSHPVQHLTSPSIHNFASIRGRELFQIVLKNKRKPRVEKLGLSQACEWRIEVDYSQDPQKI